MWFGCEERFESTGLVVRGNIFEAALRFEKV
jgi:hypothetical protein